MKNFYIITNASKDKDFTRTNYIKKKLEELGAKCTIRKHTSKVIGAYTDAASIPMEVEGVLVLGGDGTLLQAARDVINRQLPLLGINLGNLGYLAEIDADKIDEALEKLVHGQFATEHRMMLTGVIQKDVKTEDFALNDIVITRIGAMRVIYYDIYVNGQFLRSYSADGIIVSTPTGSTGYNLSAGGPIVEPKAQLILLTPVCPHTINTRSIILSAEDEIEIVINKGREGSIQEVQVSFDGSHNSILKTDDRIIITKSRQDTQIMKISDRGFLEVLHRKMSDI